MLYKDKDSQESFVHKCADSHKYTQAALKERLPIYLHDITAYTIIGGELIRIKHCPYCGAEIETDEYAE